MQHEIDLYDQAGFQKPAARTACPRLTETLNSSVAILLSVRNGTRYLRGQLDSLLRQTWTDWALFWRDDDSTDATLDVLHEFAAAIGHERSRSIESSGALGVTRSYLMLLDQAWHAGAQYFAFADQDDVWFDDKLARGLASFHNVPANRPAIYFARQVLVDADLHPVGQSPRFREVGRFLSALTQNIATGCTVILNRPAATLVLRTDPPDETLHDWWSYLVVTATGGNVLSDESMVMMYRQHQYNLVGAPSGILRRGVAAIRRGREPFMQIFRRHIAALQAHPEILTTQAGADLAVIESALRGHVLNRLRALRLPGFRRQTWLEDMVFRVWFLLG